MNKPFIIVDIDGTLANVVHREHLAQAGQWDEFHSQSQFDLPYDDVVNIVNYMSAFWTIIALTGRNEKYRTKTEDWLLQYCPVVSELIMRPDNDYRTDSEIKIGALEKRFGSKSQVLVAVQCVIDDRDKLVDALRDYGLTVFQPRSGAY